MNELTKKNIAKQALTSESIATKRVLEVIEIVDLDDCSVVLDIGSWHLKQSIELAKIFTHANIYVFEPNPPSYDLCVRKHNSLPFQMKNRIEIFKKAASDNEGVAKFYALDQTKTKSKNLGMSSLNKLKDGYDGSFAGDHWVQKEIEVECIRMDRWMEQNRVEKIDVLWMDVQGAEGLVLKGFGDKIKDIKIIFTEAGVVPYYESHWLKEELDEILQEHFVCLDSKTLLTSWASDEASEVDVIYLNKKFL